MIGRSASWSISLARCDDPILHVAAALRVETDRLTQRGARVAVLGFSTVGWHGGRAQQKWLIGGQPKRSGRLCALLHVLYEDFDETPAEDDWAVMLHPDILRENVDGEALLWALDHLRCADAARRALIVISDGAPVDDVTLLHNGLNYLERHLRDVIREAEAGDQITLAALGVGFGVDRYYALSQKADTPQDVPEALDRLIQRVTSVTG